MSVRIHLTAALTLAAALVSCASHAALHDRGGGLIYDDTLNVTWLSDASYVKTSGYDADGLLPWAQASDWVAGLSYHDSVRNVTYDDWRLPHRDGGITCEAIDCGSEIAHLFYDLYDNTSYLDSEGFPVSQYSPQIENLALFQNTWSSFYYWTDFGGGDYEILFQQHSVMGWYEHHAVLPGVSSGVWAVRSGDVAAVPEAQTYALMFAGLGLIAWQRRLRG